MPQATELRALRAEVAHLAPVAAPLLARKSTHFLLWRPDFTDIVPALFIGRFQTGRGVDWAAFRERPLTQSPLAPDLFEIAASDCELEEGSVYLYWFKVHDAAAPDSVNILYVTDPFAWAVDRSTLAPAPPEPDGVTVAAPAGIMAFRDGRLVPSDLDGRLISPLGITDSAAGNNRAPNHRLVIYELPTRWVGAQLVPLPGGGGIGDVGTGTFADVTALLQPATQAPNFPGLAQVNARAHLLELGVNALELLPPADSPQDLEWGYGTTNYFAADFELGRPPAQFRSQATFQLLELVTACHAAGVRFFPDIVMAFTRENPSLNVSALDMLVTDKDDPQRNRTTDGGSRAGFGGEPWRYAATPRPGFDPVSGTVVSNLIPARQYMKTYVSHWLDLYGIDGVRVDDIADIDNWDFNRELTQHAHEAWRAAGGDDARFIVISEELGKPAEFVRSGGTDAAWNEPWKRIARSVILGRNAGDEPSFEWSVRKLIDTSLLGFGDIARAVNYLGSHDVGGPDNQRLYNFLKDRGFNDNDIGRRIKLGFACLLTAVGIPMIFAGDEFGDSQDLPLTDRGDRNKQIDPVNFARLAEPWRRDLFDYVARLIRLRETHDGLARNETNFLHVDFDQKRVLVWQRGLPENPVVVVANFSDFGSSGGLAGEYVIPSFPRRDSSWLEVSQSAAPRAVAPGSVGREPIFPWEAKVYVLAP